MKQTIVTGCFVAGNVILLAFCSHDGVGGKVFFVVICAACYLYGFIGGRRILQERTQEFLLKRKHDLMDELARRRLAASAALARVGEPSPQR